MKEVSAKSRVKEILSLTRVIRQLLTSDETKEWLNQAEQEKKFFRCMAKSKFKGNKSENTR
ncbi:MAG: hypothetical protein PR2021_4150 [Candidatus Phytoplasma pruni]|uniref:hypothetical protein n=1 Tax=Poinsettia branch-inducing phytoplasma TaxID=138647 RepID=UPI00035DD846|nr:hypothetical protein [Poinsettia branch-inducing phytoplasma]WEK82481.1 MAG: hypothetical protein PR2021_4150 [Candidatus Phytoplasma pruni]